jgi:hypothetical protein
MFWNRKPDSKEQADLAQWAGLATGATRKGMNRMGERGLWSDKIGSIPLSRGLIDKHVEEEKQRPFTPPVNPPFRPPRSYPRVNPSNYPLKPLQGRPKSPRAPVNYPLKSL